MMAKINKIAETPKTVKLTEASKEAGERNDCAVTALAAVTGKTYKQVHKALKQAGREDRKGTFQGQAEKAAEALGFRLVRLPQSFIDSIIAQYPGIHKTLKHITTHHPVRFAKVWDQVKEPLLFHVHRHYAGYADGQLHDWSVNKPKRVIDPYRLEPITK
jgi:hypothetical protein